MHFSIIHHIHISLFMNFTALKMQTIHQRQMILTHRKIITRIIVLRGAFNVQIFL
jgi:hypothetical protein